MAITLPEKVQVQISGQDITVKGPKGELSRTMPPEVSVESDGKTVQVNRRSEHRRARAMHGLGRALVANMITGVSSGYTRKLEINGVGYRAEVKPGLLLLSLGYSHPIEVMLPDGVTAKVEKTQLEISGIDKEQLGQLAAIIRDQRPPEPYKGKGIKYVEEQIRRKVGKAGVG